MCVVSLVLVKGGMGADTLVCTRRPRRLRRLIVRSMEASRSSTSRMSRSEVRHGV